MIGNESQVKRNSKGQNTRMTTEGYIQSLPESHRNKFDYTNTTYRGCKEEIEFICPLHGKQTHKAGKHKDSPYGCRCCGNEAAQQKKRDKGKERFLNHCIKLYGDLYDFSGSDYYDMKTDLTFICKIHGPQVRKPRDMFKNTPCTECGKELRSSLNRRPEEEVVRLSEGKFKKTFEFDFSNYKNCNSLIRIYCPDHGWTNTTVAKHLSTTTGCTECYRESERVVWNSIPQEKNIEILKDLYGDKYNFFTEDIGKSTDYVRYYCKKHHNLKITQLKHLKGGYACNQCGDEVMAEKLTGWYTETRIERDKDFYLKDANNLYIFDMLHGRYKIGIAKQCTTRLSSVKSQSKTPAASVLYTFPVDTYNGFYLERALHDAYRDCRYYYDFKWKGHTEVFTLSVRQLKDIVANIKETINDKT